MPDVRATVATWVGLLVLLLVACRVRAPAGPPVPEVWLPTFDPAAVADGRPPSSGPLPPLEVRDFGPEGPFGGESIRVRFNQPVVDMRAPAGSRSEIELRLHALSEADGGSRHPVPARSEWTGSDTLELRPEGELPVATRFEVTLPAGLRNREGSEVPELRWRFETARPTVALLADDEPVLVGEPVYLTVDRRVTAEDMAEHVTVRVPPRAGEDAVPVPVRVRPVDAEALPAIWADYVDGDDQEGPWIWSVKPRGNWSEGVVGTVEVGAGLRGPEGPLPLAEPFRRDFEVRDRLRVVGSECDERPGGGCTPGSIRLLLSTELSWDAPLEVEVSPRPKDLEVSVGYTEGDDEPPGAIDIQGDFQEGRTYRVTVPASLTDDYGQRLGRRWSRRFSMGRTGPRPERPGLASLRLWDERGTYLHPGAARVGILTEHVREVRIRVVELDESTLLSLLAAPDLDEAPWPEGKTTVSARVLDPEGVDGAAEAAVDLSPIAGPGDAVMVEVEIVALTALGRREEPEAPVRGLFQISDIGATAIVGPARGVVQVTRATTAEPWAGLQVELHDGEAVRSLPTTDEDGLTRIPGAEAIGADARLVVREPDSDERVALRMNGFRWPASRGSTRGISWQWPRSGQTDVDPPAGLRRGERAMVGLQLGRGLYVPGDTVHLAGWASISTPYGELATRRIPAGTPVVIELRHDDEVVVSRRVEVDRHGRFTASMPLPAAAGLGFYSVEATALEATGSTRFMLADTRIPTFEVQAEFASGHLLQGQAARLSVDARYLSGEPTPIERMDWHMACYGSSFSAPLYAWPWTFGVAGVADRVERKATIEQADAPTAHVETSLSTESLSSAQIMACEVSVAAQDPSLQANGTDAGFRVHPARTYVGVRPPDEAVAARPAEILVEAVDIYGRRVAQPDVELVVEYETESDRRRASTDSEWTEVKRCSVDLAAEGDKARCDVRRPKAGSYRITATSIVDGIPIRTDASFEVDPPPPPPEPSTAEAPSPTTSPSADAPARVRRFDIIAPESVPAGVPLDVRIVGPWEEARRGMLTVEQTGLRETWPFEVVNGEATVRITPRMGRGPTLELEATVPEPGDPKPTLRRRSDEIRVVEERALEVAVAVPSTARPGQRVPLTISVHDGGGRPVDARVAVWVVDDGVHQLRPPWEPRLARLFNPSRTRLRQVRSGYDDILRPFHPGRFHGRGKRVPRVRQARARATGGGQMEIRQRFEAVPLYEGNVGTGPDGVVELPLTLPDDLTRFHVAAVASAELPSSAGEASGPARFGRGEAQLEVSTPLNVRAVLPRVLRPGDEVQIGALVTPPQGRPGTLTVDAVLVEADGVVSLEGPTQVRRESEGTRPVRVSFTARAEGPGTPRVRLEARYEADGGSVLLAGVERPLAVEVERTLVERAAVHGRIDRDEPVAIPVVIPKRARPDFGGLTLTLRSSAVGDLAEAAQYLEEYPYGCLEQTASRLLPVVALAGLTERLGPEAEQQRQERWATGLDHLLSMQHRDGGFGYWPSSTDTASYAGAYATWILQRAADAGHAVPAPMLDRALEFLRQRVKQAPPRSAWERRQWRAERTLVVHTLALAGSGDAPGMAEAVDDLYDHRDRLPLFGRAMLLMAVHRIDPKDERVAVLKRQISTTIEQQPGTAHPVDDGRGDYVRLFDSPARSHALVLMAWLQIEPESSLVDKLAAGLRLRRSRGRWRNTQENAYALLALSAYVRAREAVAPDHRIDAWAGPVRLGSAEHRGRDDASRTMHVTMAELLGPLGPERTTPVVLDREGVGAAHYRLGMTWTVAGDAPARSQGLVVERRLRDREGDVETLEAGHRYLLEVTISSDTPVPYVAIEVPLPAGLEAIDTRLGGGASARADVVGPRGWWVSHEELHGDRVLLFADELSAGTHVHTIPVLAATPGRFVLPATTAEAMYAPEIRARTSSSRLRVKDAR